MSDLEKHNDGLELLKPREDGYLSATLMCKRYGKLYADWARLKSTKDLLEALSLDMGIPISKLVDIVRGRTDLIEQGTWIHPDLAVQLAQWLDPQFALFVSRLVRDWFANHTQPVVPATPALPTNYVEALEHLVIAEKARQQLEADNKTLEMKQEVLTSKIVENAPKVKAYEEFLEADGLFSMANAAKIIGAGPRKIFPQLRELKILMDNNVAYQRYIDAGYLHVKTYTYHKRGEPRTGQTTYVTPKGLDFLYRRLVAANYIIPNTNGTSLVRINYATH